MPCLCPPLLERILPPPLELTTHPRYHPFSRSLTKIQFFIAITILVLTGSVIDQKRVDYGLFTGFCAGPVYGCNKCDELWPGRMWNPSSLTHSSVPSDAVFRLIEAGERAKEKHVFGILKLAAEQGYPKRQCESLLIAECDQFLGLL